MDFRGRPELFICTVGADGNRTVTNEECMLVHRKVGDSSIWSGTAIIKNFYYRLKHNISLGPVFVTGEAVA